MLPSCTVESPTESTTTVTTIATTTTSTDLFGDFQEPPVPHGGGQGLPIPPSDDEVDCENAEELCDSGEWACDDIADYCDTGPDGGELPDDWDWDR